MKQNFTFRFGKTFAAILTLSAGMLVSSENSAQVSTVCTSPSNIIYGMTGNGLIYEINVNTATTGAVIKNGTYPGSSPSDANGIGYNYVDGKFYYFKRNVSSSPQQFVSFNPSTGTVAVLANSTCTDDVHTGCVSYDGAYYYTVDIDGNFHSYNIATNTWKKIATKIVDQNNNDVDQVIRDQNAGDMAVDASGHIWLLTSSDSKYALYKFPIPLPISPVASLTVTRVISPSTSTPNGKSFAGIAFSPGGEIYIATKNGNRFYRMNDNYSLTFLGTLNTNDVGNDLTSCNFPMGVLPVTWLNFDASLMGTKTVKLNWEVEQQNTKGFYIQHSEDGNNWNDIYFVKAEKGDRQSYTYTHINNFSGRQYYRIKQTDMDDKHSFSEMKIITIGGDKQTLSVWPNPATDHIQIMNDGGGQHSFSKVQVFDLSGRMLLENKLQSSGINTINIAMLPKGMYLVKAENNSGAVFNQKICKQ